jgi:hypothetical protein
MENIKEQIAEAETYIWFFQANGNVEMEEYWKQILEKLKKDLVD